MKYDELIKRLRCKARLVREYNDTGMLEDKAADAIEELQKENLRLHAFNDMNLEAREMLHERIKELTDTNVRKWIPAKEKSPNRPGSYLCTVYGDSIGENYVTICDYSCRPWHGVTGWFGYTGANYREEVTNDVIAWMPLPEPPKDGET